MSETTDALSNVIGSSVSSGVSSIGSVAVGYIMAGLAAIFIAMGGYIWYLNNAVDMARLEVNEQKAIVALKEATINGFIGSIDRQNEAIDKITVNTDAANKNMIEVSKTIEGKYTVVPITDRTCEGKVKAYESMLKIFFNGNNK